MNGIYLNRFVLVVALPVIIGLTFSSTVKSQAWVPEKGKVSAGVYYEYIDVNMHLFSGDVILPGINLGKKVDLGDIRSKTFHFNIEYGISNRLALSASFPTVTSRYEGLVPENPALDDGLYRGSIQDFGFQIRYMSILRPVVITPSISIVIPSHDYETFGHAAIGRNLTEVHFGLYFGKLLTFVSDDLYAQAGYDFALVEKVSNIGTNRSRADISLGYFLTNSLTLNSYMTYQNTHGGIDWLEDIHNADDFQVHDRLAAADYLHLGGSVSIDVTDALNFFVAYTGTLWGENSHEIQSFAFGTNWSLRVL